MRSSTGMIASNEVHVYCFDSNTGCFNTENFQELLSPDEIIRAGNFHFEKDRLKFIQSRGILRTILARYLNKKPEQIRFDYTSFGRPILANFNTLKTINFNLSHSGDLVLYAITQNAIIGIDVERVGDHLEILQIARRFFSMGENKQMEKASNKAQLDLFFKYWTRKEAVIKGLGNGFSSPFEKIDVSSINGNFMSPIAIPGNPDINHCLYVQDLFPRQGYAGAVATDKKDSVISFYNF